MSSLGINARSIDFDIAINTFDVTIAIIGRGRVGGDCVDADDVDDDADDVDDGDVVSTAADDCGFVGTVVVVGTFVVGSGRSNQSQSEEPVVVVGVIAAAVTAELYIGRLVVVGA